MSRLMADTGASPAQVQAVLVADAGVDAVRVLAGCQRLGVKAVSVHSLADASALHAVLADEAVLLGESSASYGDVVKLVEAARQAGVDAVHPGSRVVPGLRDAVLDAGLTWLGDPLHVPAGVLAYPPAVEAVATAEESVFDVLPARAVEVVTGIDLVGAAVRGESVGQARPGVALSVDVRAGVLAPVTAWSVPDLEDVWVDAAVQVGTAPSDPLLAVLTCYGVDGDAALSLARSAWDALVIEGPVVDRPRLLEGTP